jgi:hypothetical protein
MIEKQKRTVLTKNKLELMAKFGKGELATKLAKDYGIGL